MEVELSIAPFKAACFQQYMYGVPETGRIRPDPEIPRLPKSLELSSRFLPLSDTE